MLVNVKKDSNIPKTNIFFFQCILAKFTGLNTVISSCKDFLFPPDSTSNNDKVDKRLREGYPIRVPS